MIRLTILALAMLGPAGCADGPDRTPVSEPVDYDDPAATDGEGTMPTGPGPRRIETH